MFPRMGGILALAFSCLMAAAATGQTAMPPETRNAALRYWLAYAEMHDPPPDKSIADLLEKTAAGDAAWDEAKLGPLLDENLAAIQIMRRATKLPECDWGLEYSQGPAASIAPLVKGRVLARLNAVYGMRLAAKGDTQGAVDTWVAGIRFSQHLAKGGSLIFALIATDALQSNLRALTRAVQSGALNEAQKREIEAAVRPIPETGFDWGQAMYFEEVAIAVGIRELSEAPDPAARYRAMNGKPAPEGFSRPTASDVAAFHKYMADEEEALRLPPLANGLPFGPIRLQAEAAAIQAEANSVPLALRQMVPNFERVNDVRIKVDVARQGLLDALAGKTGQPSR